jgi:hypothetical protein
MKLKAVMCFLKNRVAAVRQLCAFCLKTIGDRDNAMTQKTVNCHLANQRDNQANQI